MIKAIIIDDERLARNELRKLLMDFPEIEVVAEASNAGEGIEKIENINPDLVFLDIQMPGKTGFDMLAELDKAPHVIFTTAYDEYALKAFKVNSVDYLLKPVDPEELSNSLRKLQTLRDQLAPPLDAAVLRSLVQSLRPDQPQFKTRFLVRFADKLVFIQADDVAYFIAEDKYVFVITRDNKKYPLDHTLDELDMMLDPSVFFRLNRKFISHLKSIQSIHTYFNGKLKLHLVPAEPEEVTVSRERAALFKKWLGA